jgi:endonuclease-3 related protein
MVFQPLSIPALLDRLESFHGVQEPHWPVDPYQFLIWWHCGYPASDAACARGWKALSSSVGIEPEQILAASPAKLAAALKAGGMVPEIRATRLQQIAQRVQNEFGGDLRAGLVGRIGDIRKSLKIFPGIADPGVDRILLFARVAPIAAVPSNCPHVLVRIQLGKEPEDYGATYRLAQSALDEELPAQFHARTRAFLLLKEHGQTLCKRTKPKCDGCPLEDSCAYAAGIDRTGHG